MIESIFSLGNDAGVARLAQTLSIQPGSAEVHRFPDGESSYRVSTPTNETAIFCSLFRPEGKALSIRFLAETLREQGAKRVGLVAPYMAYMRQDRSFHPGEGITQRQFARFLSETFDWVLTVDPHLHRIHSLQEIFTVPAVNVAAAPAVAAWVSENIAHPLFIGPDEESGQWVRAVAKLAGAPATVLSKTRRGDSDVQVSLPEVSAFKDLTPVLVDDIISTARTMIETVGHLNRMKMKPPVCIGVHGVFAEKAYQDLQQAGAATIVTCDSIPHESNRISLIPSIAEALKEAMLNQE